MAEEVRRVQSRHHRVLGQLNLSVEAMLMPTTVDNNEEELAQETRGTSTEELLPSVGPADDLLSRVGCDMDSGFSGSSTASYRYVALSVNCHRIFFFFFFFSLNSALGFASKVFISVLFEFNLQIGLGILKKRNGENERFGTDRRSTQNESRHDLEEGLERLEKTSLLRERRQQQQQQQ